MHISGDTFNLVNFQTIISIIGTYTVHQQNILGGGATHLQLRSGLTSLVTGTYFVHKLLALFFTAGFRKKGDSTKLVLHFIEPDGHHAD